MEGESLGSLVHFSGSDLTSTGFDRLGDDGETSYKGKLPDPRISVIYGVNCSCSGREEEKIKCHEIPADCKVEPQHHHLQPRIIAVTITKRGRRDW